ncbi:MAG: response regulator transcription factor [Chloroflexi bacterium]|nr:response regulator transcription factor [Chloroflexota bacterium]
MEITRIKLVSVEPHPSLCEQIRRALQRVLGFEIIGEAPNAEQAVKLLADRAPDVVIADIHLPDMCSLQAVPLWLGKAPQAQVILLTDEDDERYTRAAKKNGASACLRKDRIGTGLPGLVNKLMEARRAKDSTANSSLRKEKK